MKTRPLAGLCLALLAGAGCTASTHVVGTASSDVAGPPLGVDATSMRSSYGIQIRLEGAVTRRGNWLYVSVPSGAVRTYQGTAPAWDLSVRAGLASCTGSKQWKVVSESRAARIAPLVGLTIDDPMLDTTTRAFKDTLRLDLGIPPGIDLARSWLTIEPAWPIAGVIASYELPASPTLDEAHAPAERVCRTSPPAASVKE